MNDTISNNYARYPSYPAPDQSTSDKGSRRGDNDNQDDGAEVTRRVDTDRAAPAQTDSPLAALGAHCQAPVDVEQTQDASAADAVDGGPVDVDAVRDALAELLNDPEQFNRILASVIDDTQYA